MPCSLSHFMLSYGELIVRKEKFMQLEDYIATDLLDRFEFYNYNHAIEIITQTFPDEWAEITDCLRKLDITTDDLREAGGNETKIPQKIR